MSAHYLERARAWILSQYEPDEREGLDREVVEEGATRLAAEFRAVVAEEREACAKECEAVAADCRLSGERYIASECAGSVRDRTSLQVSDGQTAKGPER